MDSFDLAIRQRFANVERCQEDMHHYQTDIAIPFLRENPFSGLFADMGLGKSISVLTLLSWILSEFIHDGKILIIGPVRVVTDTWPTEIAKWAHTAWMNHTVIRVDDDDPRLTAVAKKDREGAWDRDFDRSVMLGKGMTEPEIREALDSTNKTKERYRIMGELATSPASIHLINREQVDWLCDFYQAKWPYRVVIIDECFVGETLVMTPAGERPISELRQGDFVTTPYGDRQIQRVIVKSSTCVINVNLEDGSTIRCTPSHRFFTDAGWVEAKALKGRTVYGQSHIEAEELRTLRSSVLDLEVTPSVLFAELRKKIAVGQRSNGPHAHTLEGGRFIQNRAHPMEQGCATFKADKDTTVDAVGSSEIYGDPRWQWEGDEPARSVADNVSCARMGVQSRCDSWGIQGQRLPVTLQDRLRLAGQNDGDRSRRVESFKFETASTRSQEGKETVGIRVDSVSSYEQTGEIDVYDLSVDGAPFYFAGRVLVHNCSGFKDHNSNRFKALAKMRRTPGLIERFHILTATPAAEGLIGLFTQIYLLDQGKRLGKNITAYRNRYFIQNKYSHKYELRSQSDEEVILEKIADITLVMKKKDYLPTVEPTIIQQKVKLDASQLALMKELETHFVVTLPNGVELEAKTAAALASMMLQMASGAVYETLLIGDYETEDLKKVKRVHHLHDHKIDALREIVEAAENEGRPLLVAYHWQSSLARLKKAFPQAVVMDVAGKCIKKWTAGKIPILLVHPQSAGHGLNLQYGGSTLIFFDLVYSLELYLQTIGRIDRQGQTLPVVVKMLVAEGTRDELVAECLANKEDAQDRFFATLRRLIRKLRKMAEAEDDL